MKIEQFLQRHGEAWNVFKRDPMFIDLLATLETYSPHRKSCNIDVKISSEHSQYILGTVAGFASVLDLMENQISFEQKITEPEANYEEPPV